MAFYVGRGISDITGEAADCGMLGYGMADQQSAGIHLRQRSRAFIFAESFEAPRILLVVNEIPLLLESIHQSALAELQALYGDRYGLENTMLTATHTHCAPGGYSHHQLYNSNTRGFRPKTFRSIIDGILEAVARAESDFAPSQIRLAHGELHNASINRSPIAFARNSEEDRSFFPGTIDSQSTLLEILRDGQAVGAINWFGSHCTSMTNRNRLISSDNRGYASYAWERLENGVDYLSDAPRSPSFVAAFAQSNAGDMSPNLGGAPGQGPGRDEFDNTRILGTRIYEAARRLSEGQAVEISGPLACAATYVDLSDVTVDATFTEDGISHRTSGPASGAASFAGASVDGPAFKAFKEGPNRFWDWPSKQLIYRLSKRLRDSQAPKGIVISGAWLSKLRPLVAQRVPVQLLRFGPLVLIGIPGEVTITAGLRLRRSVASELGLELKDVIVAGYANGYIHYVTTPEEYDAQRYEGASTLFGRWELAALQQTAVRLASELRDGIAGDPVAKRVQPPRVQPRSKQAGSWVDKAFAQHAFGEVLEDLQGPYDAGDSIQVSFVGAHLSNDLHRGGSFLEVQRLIDGEWLRVHDDGDWSTKIHWKRLKTRRSRIDISWDIPSETKAGDYRIHYCGDARSASGQNQAFSGYSSVFSVRARQQDSL